jgi:hypothetical protein
MYLAGLRVRKISKFKLVTTVRLKPSGNVVRLAHPDQLPEPRFGHSPVRASGESPTEKKDSSYAVAVRAKTRRDDISSLVRCDGKASRAHDGSQQPTRRGATRYECVVETLVVRSGDSHHGAVR